MAAIQGEAFGLVAIACTCIGPGQAFTWWSGSPCWCEPGRVQRRQRRQGVRCSTVVVIQAADCTVPARQCPQLVELVAVLACSWPGAGRRRRQGVRCPTVAVIQAADCTVPARPGPHLVELVAVLACSWPGARRQRRPGVHRPTVVVIQGEAFGLVAMACTVPPGPGLHLVELVAVLA